MGELNAILALALSRVAIISVGALGMVNGVAVTILLSIPCPIKFIAHFEIIR